MTLTRPEWQFFPPSTSTLLQAGQGAVVMLPDGIRRQLQRHRAGGSVSVSASVAFNSTPNPAGRDDRRQRSAHRRVVRARPGRHPDRRHVLPGLRRGRFQHCARRAQRVGDARQHEPPGDRHRLDLPGTGRRRSTRARRRRTTRTPRGSISTNATFHVYDNGSGGIAVYATGTVGVVGIPGVTLSGTVTIEWNTTWTAHTRASAGSRSRSRHCLRSARPTSRSACQAGSR